MPFIYLHVGTTECKMQIDDISSVDEKEDGGCIVVYNSVQYEVNESKEEIDDAILTAKYYKQEGIKHINSLLEQ
jgi:hypothetical protein